MIVAAARLDEAQVAGETGQSFPLRRIVIWMRYLDTGQASPGQPGDNIVGNSRAAARSAWMREHRHPPGRPDQRDRADRFRRVLGHVSPPASTEPLRRESLLRAFDDPRRHHGPRDMGPADLPARRDVRHLRPADLGPQFAQPVHHGPATHQPGG